MELFSQSSLWVVIGIGFVLAATWVIWQRWRARWLPRPLEFAKAKFADIGPFKIRYVQEGRGEDLVLLHGIGANIYSWRLIFQQLAKSYRVTAIDLPGFGQSSKRPDESYGLDAQSERLVQLFDRIGIKRARIIGSSMGGTLALWLAKRDPHRFYSVVCIAPATNPKLTPPGLSSLTWTSGLAAKALNPAVMRILIGRVVQRSDLITDECVQAYLEPYQDSGESIETFLKATSAISDRRLPSELATVNTPALILWGQHDKMVKEKYMTELNHHLPYVTYFKSPNGGHHLMEDEPSWVVEKTLQFFGATKKPD